MFTSTFSRIFTVCDEPQNKCAYLHPAIAQLLRFTMSSHYNIVYVIHHMY